MANNPYVNKVNLSDGTTLIDLTSDTVAAGKMLSGTTAHDKSGAAVTGNIPTKTSSDMTVSGKTVTAPAGYYASAQSKSVADGTEGTPTATKGTVSNNAVSVTPSVTNSAGYISGGTKTGTAVTVSASELVSGTKAISASGSTDVTNYKYASVSAGTITNNTSGGTSSGTVNRGNQIKIGAGYYASDAYYTAQNNSGTKNITSSGTTSVDGYANVSVSAGTITNNTSGGTSSGTINRGSQIKIGTGYYSSDKYYTAQSNSGTKDITSYGTISCDGYANVSVPQVTFVIDVTATSSTSKTISNSNITSSCRVYTMTNTDAGSDISWTTSDGSITLSCSSGIPAMKLMIIRIY